MRQASACLADPRSRSDLPPDLREEDKKEKAQISPNQYSALRLVQAPEVVACQVIHKVIEFELQKKSDGKLRARFCPSETCSQLLRFPARKLLFLHRNLEGPRFFQTQNPGPGPGPAQAWAKEREEGQGPSQGRVVRHREEKAERLCAKGGQVPPRQRLWIPGLGARIASVFRFCG